MSRYLAPILLGKDMSDPASELQALLAPVKGNQFAKAALDQAWWDMYCPQPVRAPLEVLGGAAGQP